MNITVDPTTNQINMSGFTYDAAGNLTHTPDGKTYAYDSENRTSQGNEGTYYYDANGLRLASVSSDGTTGTWYFRGPNGIELNLYTAPSSTGCGLYSGLYSGFCVSGSAPEKLYFAGRLVMQGDAQSALNMSTVTDRLGSVVQTSSYQGSDYYPYGGNPSGFPPNQTAFATYEAAGTSMLYAQNRFYDSARGRFTTPDPAASGEIARPNSWNRYAYTEGDPINYNDPEGLFIANPWYQTGQNWMNFFLFWGPMSPARPPGPLPADPPNDALYPECNKGGSAAEDKRLGFLVAGYGASAALGKQYGVPTDWILGWAAEESGYGQATTQAKTQGNYFNESLPKGSSTGGWAGAIPCSANAAAGWACFPDFAASAFAAVSSKYGNIISTMLQKDPNAPLSAVFQAVADAGYAPPGTPDNAGYGDRMKAVIKGSGRSVDSRLDCLKQNGYFD